MRKLLGYIPLDPGEDHIAIAKETDVVKIEQQWFKLAEVWIPGVALVPTHCGNVEVKTKPDEFTANPENTRVCINCGKTRAEHLFFTVCPKK